MSVPRIGRNGFVSPDQLDKELDGLIEDLGALVLLGCHNRKLAGLYGMMNLATHIQPWPHRSLAHWCGVAGDH